MTLTDWWSHVATVTGADDRLDAAIARRNTTWAHYQAAAQLLRAAESRYAGAELAPYVRNVNQAQDDFEAAVAELVRARATWRRDHGAAGVSGGGAMSDWICTRCGGGGCSVLDGRPSLDDRFAVGWCDRCTPIPTFDPAKPHVQKCRGTVVLARDTTEVRAEIERRDQATRDRKLVERVMADKGIPDGARGDALREQAADIRRRWAAEAEARRSS